MRCFNLSGGGSQTETRQDNSLGQLTRLTIPGQLDREYRFSATANDGKVTQQKDYVTGEELGYQYDSLGRLANAETTGAGGWGMSFVYDGWGNRLQQNVVKGSVPTQSILVDPATNRIQSHSYDSNGNTTNTPAQGAMTFDVMDRLKTVASDTYGYTPANQRQWKNSDFTLWGADGVRVVTAQVATIGSDLRFTQLAFDSYSHGRRLQVTDRLGSVGNYFPYGEAKSGTVSNADSFATYYRDSSGLDYAQQRYYQPASGRFLTTDPSDTSIDATNPVAWNRYEYSLSDPVNRNDPRGESSAPASPLPTAACVGVGLGQQFCFIDVLVGNRVFRASAGGADLASTQAAALQIYQGFDFTQQVLEGTLQILASGLTDACWSALNSIRIVDPELPIVRVKLDPKSLRSQIVNFHDATAQTTPSSIRNAFLAKPKIYAYTPYGPERSGGPGDIYWRPGELGYGRSQANWMPAAVLHEALHVFGVTDEDLQTSFGLTVNLDETDNITRFLDTTCFSQ